MIMPNYWLKRPVIEFNQKTQVAYDALIHSVLDTDDCSLIDLSPSYPKWQFLCYVSDHYDIVLHGSNNSTIDEFEPRQADDVSEFGNQKAIYAASDGIWSMFFAIVDRQNFTMSINNACIYIEDQDGTIHNPRYVFAISHGALVQKPWCKGSVYLLPKQTFTQQVPFQTDKGFIHTAQFASLRPAKPIAKLEITPEDFPFLNCIREMDENRSQEYVSAMYTGTPWPKVDDR